MRNIVTVTGRCGRVYRRARLDKGPPAGAIRPSSYRNFEKRADVANHKQAEKRNRQRLKRRTRNLMHLSTMRTYMKRVRKALDGKDGEAAKTLPEAIQAISKAASKGVIHRNTASRYISRLTLATNKSSAT